MINRFFKQLLLATVVTVIVLPMGGRGLAGDAPTGSRIEYPKPKDNMIFVPAGEFTIGCVRKVQRRCDDDALPSKKVYLDAFFIDTYEVTNREYAMCIASGACTRPYPREGFDEPDQPVGGVTWFQAAGYCSWLGKRLPTEAEWEKAARGTDARTFPWGNDKATCEYAVMYYKRQDACGENKTWPVGSKPEGVSPYGVYDMAGNAWEWVNDWYSVDYYEWGPDKNPKGPEIGQYRGLRGGAWETRDYYLRTCYRVKMLPNYRHHHFGFRCARSP